MGLTWCAHRSTKVHMRDLPPPRETRSAAALIGVRDIGHRKSEPVIASVRGVDLLTNKPCKMGNVGGSSKPARAPAEDRPKSRLLVQLYKAKSRFVLTIRLPRPPHAPLAQVRTFA